MSTPGLDSMIYASVRQVASTWYALGTLQKRLPQEAETLGMMQAELYLSDLGIVEGAQPYLDGARKAICHSRSMAHQNEA